MGLTSGFIGGGGTNVQQLVRNSSANYEGFIQNSINNTTFNTTIGNTLVITAQWNTTNAGNSIFTNNFTLTKIY